MKRILAVILLALLLLSSCSHTEKPLRLHIIANSDSDYDQTVKLLVRDEILKQTAEEISKCETMQEAKAYMGSHLDFIREIADNVLSAYGAGYTSSATLGVSHFPEKTYAGVTYPEDDYEALKVVLGDGGGQNWWCVIFPPLCLVEAEPAANETVEYKSFLSEFFGSLFQ